MSKKLYVGNLPFDTGEEALQTLFAGAGTVETVNVVRDNSTGRPRGFAFIEMASDQDAQSAIAAFNNYDLNGRALTVNEARPRPQSGGGFSSGGGFGSGGGNGRRSGSRW